MCRLMAYVGQPQLLADIVLWPDRSIIKQSYDARERKQDPTLPFHLGHGNLNGDGFGIGWFSTDDRREKDPSPCVFTSITPAWNNENLSRLSCKIVSPLVFAHVRAAYPGMPVSEQNCHPFQWGRYMWMHNGVVGAFVQIKRALLETLNDTAYNAIQSFHSDSAVSFALFLNALPDMHAQLPPDVLIKATQSAISTITSIQRAKGITAVSLLNFVVSDGTTLIATRFVAPDTEGPASLYYAEGSSFARERPHAAQAVAAAMAAAAAAAAGKGAAASGVHPAPVAAAAATSTAAAAATLGAAGRGQCTPCAASSTPGSSVIQESSYELGFSAQGPRVVFVASEPITAAAVDWVAVPKNTALVITREKGGYLNILRCPLNAHGPAASPGSVVPAAPSATAAALVTRFGRDSGGGGGSPSFTQDWGAGCPPGGAYAGLLVDPQREVALCLEALSRGRTAKSRAFLVRHPGGTSGHFQGVQAPGTGTGLLPAPPADETSATPPASYGLAAEASPASMNGLSPKGAAAEWPGNSRMGSLGYDQGPEEGEEDTHDFMRLVGHTAPVIAMMHCHDTDRLYTSSVDCTVKVWSLLDNSCIRTLLGQRKPVAVMKLRASGKLLLACSGRKIRVWETGGFRCLHVIKISDSCGIIRCLEVISAPKPADPAPAAAAASNSTSQHYRDSFNGFNRPSISGSSASVGAGNSSSSGGAGAGSSPDISMDGRAGPGSAGTSSDGTFSHVNGGRRAAPARMYIGCQDTTVKVFPLDEDALLAAAAALGHADDNTSDISFAAASAFGPSGRSWVALPSTWSGAAQHHQANAGHAAPTFLPQPHQIITTTDEQDPTVVEHLPDLVTPAVGGHVGPVNALTTCGEYLCSSGGDAMVRVWEASSLRLAGVLRGHRSSVLCLLGLSSGLLLSGARDNTIRVWDLEMDMMCRRTLVGHKDDVTALAAITLHWNGGTALSQPPDVAVPAGVPAGGAAGGSFSRASFTPGGLLSPGGRIGADGLTATIIASSSADGTVRLWSTTWACLCILSLPASAHPVAGPGPAGGGGADVGACGGVRDAAPAASHAAVPAALCATLNSRLAMSGFSDGEVRLWHVEDVQAAVLQHCLGDPWVMGAADVLQAACGCLLRQQQDGAVALSRNSTSACEPTDDPAHQPAAVSPPAPPAAAAQQQLQQQPQLQAERTAGDGIELPPLIGQDEGQGNSAAVPDALRATLGLLSHTSVGDWITPALEHGGSSPGGLDGPALDALPSAAPALATCAAAASGAASVRSGPTSDVDEDDSSGAAAATTPNDDSDSSAATGGQRGHHAPSLAHMLMRQRHGRSASHDSSVRPAGSSGALAGAGGAPGLLAKDSCAASMSSSRNSLDVWALQQAQQHDGGDGLPLTRLAERSSVDAAAQAGELQAQAVAIGDFDLSPKPSSSAACASATATGTAAATAHPTGASPSRLSPFWPRQAADAAGSGRSSTSGAPGHAASASAEPSAAMLAAYASARGRSPRVSEDSESGQADLLAGPSRPSSDKDTQPASATVVVQPIGAPAHVAGGDVVDSAAAKPEGHAAPTAGPSAVQPPVAVDEGQLQQAAAGAQGAGGHPGLPPAPAPVRLPSQRSLKLYGPSGFSPSYSNGAAAAAGCLPDGSCCPTGGSGLVRVGSALLSMAPGLNGSNLAVPIHIHGRKSLMPAHGAAPGVSDGAAALSALAAAAAGAVTTPFGSHFAPPALAADGFLGKLLESRRQSFLQGMRVTQFPGAPGAGCNGNDQQLEAALREFVRLKTISVSPKHRDDCHKGAKYIARMLEGLGADVKVVQVLEDKNPVVIGRLGYAADRPTVTFYGHYDVQPAAEPDWRTNPFELNSVNEYLYGRGVSDNKGPILAFIFAVRELMNGCGSSAVTPGSTGGGLGGGVKGGGLPVNVAFIFEGEEENGSKGFRQAIAQNIRWFEGTQLIVISNTQWVGENVPCLTYGMRGMLSLSIQITGPERDVHSGNDGGVFAEPMVDLVRVMGTLIGAGGAVQVPGFYDDVEPGLVDLAWSSLEASEEFSLQGYKAALGVPRLTAPPKKRDLLVTRWCRPSLSVVDMRPGGSTAAAVAAAAAASVLPPPGRGERGTGQAAQSQAQQPHVSTDVQASFRFGPTRFSVIPKSAEGKVSVRFVPNQDADKLVACLRSHVQAAFDSLDSPNRIDLHVEARGNWWEARPGSPWLTMAEAAIRKEWGVDPLYVREGGTMPVASHLERMLDAPAIMIPMGQSSDNCHLANERIRRTNLFKGKNVIRRLLEEVAAAGQGMQAAAATAAATGAALVAPGGAPGAACGASGAAAV